MMANFDAPVFNESCERPHLDDHNVAGVDHDERPVGD